MPVKNLRITARASELSESERWCTCCRKPLSGKFAWLELDQRVDAYHDFGGVPAEKSQGWFPFGMTCAKKANRQVASAIAVGVLEALAPRRCWCGDIAVHGEKVCSKHESDLVGKRYP